MVERSQFGSILNKADGEAGYGIYAHLPSMALHKYYSKNGELSFALKLDKSRVVDLTTQSNTSQLIEFAKHQVAQRETYGHGYKVPKINKSNIQRFGSLITQFMQRNFPEAGAYIVRHKGPGLPTGKQVVITDESVILDTKEIT